MFFDWFKRRLKQAGHEAMEEFALELDQSLGPASGSPVANLFRDRINAMAALPAPPDPPTPPDASSSGSASEKPKRIGRQSS